MPGPYEAATPLSGNCGKPDPHQSAVFGYDGTADDTAITQHIKNIRAKLRAAGAGEVLQTIWGVGYQWKNES